MDRWDVLIYGGLTILAAALIVGLVATVHGMQ